jgi:hypothetical protein
LLLVESHEELHAAERCLIAAVPGHSLDGLLRGPVPFRGGQVDLGRALRRAKHAHPDTACCNPPKPLGSVDIREARRTQRDRLNIRRVS